jgi:hypothetical protein
MYRVCWFYPITQERACGAPIFSQDEADDLLRFMRLHYPYLKHYVKTY